MHGLPQAGRIAHYDLLKFLGPYGYQSLRKTTGLWTHDSWPINSTLVVDYFWLKYSGKYHNLHLKSELEDKYKVTIDWEVKLYIGIALKWYFGKGTIQLPIT